MLCMTTSSHITTAPLHIAAAVNRYGGDGGGRERDVKYVVYLLSRLELGTRGASQSAFQEGQASERERVSRLLCCRLIFRIEGTAPERCPSSFCSPQQQVSHLGCLSG